MKKPLIILLISTLALSASACSGSAETGNTADSSTFTSEEVSKMFQTLPDPDEYPTESELNSYAFNYRMELDLSEENGDCMYVVERFENTAAVYEGNREYEGIKNIYDKACAKIGKIEGATKKKLSDLSACLTQSASLDDDKNILLNYSFRSPEKIHSVFLTFTPYDSSGTEIRYNNGLSPAITQELQKPFKAAEKKLKIETSWKKLNVSECRLTIAVITTTDGTEVYK